MNKKIITIVAVVGVIILLALPKLNLFSDDKASTTTTPVAAKLPIEVLIIKSGSLDNKLVVTGSVLANESLELKSESGYVFNLRPNWDSHLYTSNKVKQVL